MHTEETYDTSNPSNSQHYTPNSLTPRSSESFFQPTAVRERRSSNHNAAVAPPCPMETIISMGMEETSQVVDMGQNTMGPCEASMNMSMDTAMMRGMVQPATYDYYQ
jgi:hypothetical protein